MNSKDGRQLSVPVSKQLNNVTVDKSSFNAKDDVTNIKIEYEGQEPIEVIIVVIHSLRKQWVT